MLITTIAGAVMGRPILSCSVLGVGVLAAALTLVTVEARADELRVKHWPDDVPCSALTHKSDGSWVLSDQVIGPDGTRHYPNPDRDSYENRAFGQKCNK